MAADLISEIIDQAAIDKQITGINTQLDTLAKRLKEFPTLGGDTSNLKNLIAENKAYEASLKSLSTTQKQVIDTEKIAAIERKRIADERTQQARTAAADLKLEQIEIQKRAIVEKQAAIASIAASKEAAQQRQIEILELKKKNAELSLAAREQINADLALARAAKERATAEKEAAANAVAAGRERIIQLKEEQATLERAAEAERQRDNAEQQALSGTFNPGSGAKAAGAPGAAPVKLTIAQGDILLLKTYEAEVAKLNAEILKSKAAFQEGSISLASYQKTAAVSTERINLLKSNIKGLSTEIRLNQAVVNSERNSTDRAKALMEQYAFAKGKLNVSTEDGKRLNESYGKAIEKANEFLLKNADAETQRIKNIGNYGTAINKILGPIRTLANILPGIGLSGIFLAGFEAIKFVVEELGLFNSKLSDTQRQRELLLQVEKDASANYGKEVGQLQILRASIENTSVPMATRLQGIKDLKKEFPDLFAGLTNEQILTGKVGNAYDVAAKAILRKAKASAAASQIEANASKELNILQEDLRDTEATNAQLRRKNATTTDEFGNIVETQKQTNQLIKEGFANRQKARIEERNQIVKDNNFLLGIAVDGAKEIIKIEETKPKAVKKSAKERIDVEYEVYRIQQQLRIDQSKGVVDDEKESFNARLLFLQTYIQQRGELINRSEQHEIKEAKGNKDKLKIIEAKFNDERLRLAIEGQKILDQFRDTQDIAKDKATEERQKALNERLHNILQAFVDKQAAINAKAEKDKEDKEKAAAARQADYLKQRAELIKQLYKEIQQTIFQFLDDGLKREEQDLDERKRLLDEDTKRRLSNIDQLGLSEIERTKQKSAVEKNAQFQTEQIEKRKRAIEVQRAKFEKAASIASIISGTAQAVIAALKVGPPQGFVLAGLVGAIGALQLARAISTPLPKYKVGTDSAKVGPGIFGELGRELVIPKDGAPYLSPAVPTLTSFIGGEKIIPADMTARMLKAVGIGGLAGMDPRKPVTQDSVNNHLLKNMNDTLKNIERKSGLSLTISHDLKASAWYKYHFKN